MMFCVLAVQHKTSIQIRNTKYLMEASHGKFGDLMRFVGMQC